MFKHGRSKHHGMGDAGGGFNAVAVMGLVLLSLLMCGGRAVVAGGALPHTVTTENYRIRTDAGEEFANLVAGHMESIYEEYRRRFPDYEQRSPGRRFTINVFSRRRDYNDAIPSRVRGTAGVFIPGQRLLASFKEGRTQEQVLRTLYHEGFHQFLHEYVGTDVPLWVNEGFAEYFSEATWDGNRFRTGQRPWQRLHVVQSAIEEGKHIPLRELFLVDNDEWLAAVREDDTRANLQYSQAWSVVHFLVHARGGRFRERLFEYLRSISAGDSRAKAFEGSFGTNIGGMEDAWKRYVTGLSPDNMSSCRKDMELILFLAASVYDSPEEMDSIRGFVRDVFRDERLRWSFRAPDGERISSEDRGRLRRMLVCPEHGRRDVNTSYVLLMEDGMPELYCLHHDGIVIKAYLVRDGRDLQARSEVIVRRTLPEGLLRRLRRAAR